MPGASIDLGGLQNFANNLRSHLTGPFVNELGNKVLTDVMPELIGQVADAAGTPIASVGFGFRVVPSVTVGASGVSAEYTIPTLSEEDMPSPTSEYAKFPIIRHGGKLAIVTTREPEVSGQQSLASTVERSGIQEAATGLAAQAVDSALETIK